ncbi:ABC transporter ATP-binding protein [Pseudoclavibacter helvolus]|uniref:ABC-type quaternary amine transporter n=1 Tax=Pseudoclavibacter helvolus TaxID=255205 RepID=A0A7W4URL1_9MICO|nr:ATP-binding cassette domain-containing protein [Pseudoclavibacter helvolus]MBB2959346.1 osmoprotectant transport system ATP-binding protein [Pseudoclavibacter helvolus]
MITFESVTKTYPDGTTAVNDLSLNIEEGSFTAFVGPSGCGKTTSMRMINKMIDASSGRITVAGKDVAHVPSTQLRLGIGYVIQNAGLFPHRTVLDNVATVLRLKGVPAKEARAKAMDAIERVRLRPELVHRYPADLSGGQQQRVGVARALAADPPILLMDEPFSAVDPVVRDELQQEMIRLQRELKKTIVFVTHDIDEALILGDKIAVFGPGGVLHQYAAAEEVMTRPANTFVSSMISKDRGYRALTFRDASLTAEPLAEPVAGIISLDPHTSEWSLAVDDNGRPDAWLHRASSLRVPVGAVVTLDDNLRRSLDAVLASPASLAVVVDEAGVAAGIVRGETVFARVAEASGDRS